MWSAVFFQAQAETSHGGGEYIVIQFSGEIALSNENLEYSLIPGRDGPTVVNDDTENNVGIHVDIDDSAPADLRMFQVVISRTHQTPE